MRHMQYDVCIIGAGTAGMAAAYALKNSGHTVILIEKQPELGGTATQGWVDNWIAGINLSYFTEIFNTLPADKKAGNLDESWLPSQFSGNSKSNGSLSLEHSALAAKYREDMSKSSIETLLCYTFISANIESRRVKSITIENSKESVEVEAKFFIDCSGDGVLCTFQGTEGVDYFIGEDPHERFGESLMLYKTGEPLKAQRIENEPSLFFEVNDGFDDTKVLEPAQLSVYMDKAGLIVKPSDITNDGYPSSNLINPMTGQGVLGTEVFDEGYDAIYKKVSSLKQFEYWKYIKLELSKQAKAENNNIDNKKWKNYPLKYYRYGHTGKSAPMLGVRETARIHCDTMLVQKDLEMLINPDKLGNFIACGSHNIDFHVYGSMQANWEVIQQYNNTCLRPSGIPYGCLIPRRYDNVLVACRAFGASHIALAARRVNKDMAQLGWAAGHAMRICIDKNLNNTRDVDVKILQDKEHTNFANNAAELRKRMKGNQINNNNKMKSTELKSGDILLCPPVPFSISEPLTCLGHIIIMITGGKVSHAAIYCGNINDVPTVAHSDLPGIATVKLSDFLMSEHTCYVFRNKYTNDAQPVAKIAIDYTKGENPYPLLNLGVLGVLLLFNKFSKHTLKNKIFYDFVVWLSLKIMQQVQKVKNPGKTPMTCSQFAAQCTTDAGCGYDVKFDKMLIQFGALEQNSIHNSTDNNATLLSYILENRANGILECKATTTDENQVMENERAIIENFAKLLENKSVDTSSNNTHDICDAGEMLLEALKMHSPDLVRIAMETNDSDTNFSTYRNYFVAPDDLYFNTNNLEYIGELNAENV